MPDLRYAFRTLARNPGFSAIVILILAIGIGANTAMFSIVNGVLLRPLPFQDPERLYAVQELVPQFSFASALPVSAHHFTEWRRDWHAAERIAVFTVYSTNLTSGGEPERIHLARASASLFPLLGVQPQIGRIFTEEEDHPGRDKVVVITDSLWRDRFQGDPALLGRKILLDGVPFEVIGVLPPGLSVPKVSQLQSMKYGDVNPDLWKPLAIGNDEMEPVGDFNFAGIVRLKPGVSASQALDELNAIQEGIVQRFVKQHLILRASLVPLQAQITGRSRQGLLLLLGAVRAVLLIVCVNIANLLLARATARKRELAIRAAVGASSRRLLRQMMTESLLFAAAGGALGIALAYQGLKLIVANAPADLPRVGEIQIDARVLGVAILLTLGSALLFGLIPAWRSSRSDPQEGLKTSSRGSTEGRQSGRLRSLLVAFEVGLSTVCLMAAGLLLNSFVHLMHVDRGFEVERITTADLNLPSSRYPDAAARAKFLKTLIDDVRVIPGVSGAAVANMLPLDGEGNNSTINLDGSTIPELERPIADRRIVSEDYFRVMGIPLAQGRAFQTNDPRKVAIVSATTAARVWPHEDAVGKTFHMGSPTSPPLEVIGIAADVRANSLQAAAPMTVYMPYWQRDQRDMSLAVRTAVEPASISEAVRGEIRRLDSELPVPRLRTMREIVSASVGQRRFQLTLVLLFSGIGLVLASLGIYGVVSYAVQQRRGEMGIRMALGATASDLRTQVMRQGLMPVAIGLAAGIAAALILGRLLSGMLFGVSFADPVTIAGVAAVLFLIAAAACYVPALRVTRADPLTALRYE